MEYPSDKSDRKPLLSRKDTHKEKSTSSANLNTWMVVIGYAFIFFPVSPSVYLGNFLPYLFSYYYVNNRSAAESISPLWVVSMFRVINPLGMVLGGLLSKRLGVRIVIYGAGFLLTLGWALSFFSIVHPLSLVMTNSIMGALGCGATYAMGMKLVSEVNVKKIAINTAIVSLGPSIGSLIIIAFTYLLINPDNQTTDTKDGNLQYYAQPDIVHRVPYFYIMMTAVSILSMGTGHIMVYCGTRKMSEWCASSQTTMLSEEGTAGINLEKIYSSAKTEDTVAENAVTNFGVDSNTALNGEVIVASDLNISKGIFSDSASNQKPNKGKNENGIDKALSKEERRFLIEDRTLKEEREKFSHKDQTLNEEETKVATKDQAFSKEGKDFLNTDIIVEEEEVEKFPDYSTWELLKQEQFWRLYMMAILLQHTIYIHVNFYKQYGELYLPNDALLTLSGILAMAFSLFIRMLSGYLVGRFGSKLGLVFLCSSSCLFMTLMPIVVRYCPPLYIVLVVLETSCIFLSFMLYGYSAFDLFGPTYYASNLGLVHTNQIPIMIIEPFILPHLVQSVGWDYIYLSGMISAFLAFLLSLTTDDIKRRK